MENCHLLIVLQTHSLGDSLDVIENKPHERFVKQPKAEVTRRCVSSLVDSINYAKSKLPDADFKLVVLDDHSDSTTIKKLNSILGTANFYTKLVNLETRGIMPSILQCYQYGYQNGKELVYFAQDDYLYHKNAILDMIEAFYTFSNNLQQPVCIYPFDDPLRYSVENIALPCRIVRLKDRHWRTQVMTASCFMIQHEILKENWDLFFLLGNTQLSDRQEVNNKLEDRSINQLFISRGYTLFVPIPSLAYHMQYDCHIDNTSDWLTLWEKHK